MSSYLSTASTHSPIFITARFRSGSTLLWNLFDNANGFRAYYEPCHDNLLAHIRHTMPIKSHRGVENYWRSYKSLFSELERHHQPDFGFANLIMEENDQWHNLKKYLIFLVKASAPDIAVLQFNRADFRLPWLRKNFPDAKIIHLYRDSRESFFSMTRHLRKQEADDPLIGNVYELLEWSLALSKDFPFLADPSIDSLYMRHYYIWKLSFLMGTRCSDFSLSYDDHFQNNRKKGLKHLAEAGFFDSIEIYRLAKLVQPKKSGSWKKRYSQSWFAKAEQRCEKVLDDLGLNEHFGYLSLNKIRRCYQSAWNRFKGISGYFLATALLKEYSRQRSEITSLLSLVRGLEARKHIVSQSIIP